MRNAWRAMAMALLSALAAGAAAASELESVAAPSPFPVQPGTAAPPPSQTVWQTAPPEGVGPGGIDFGPWRSADPSAYAPAFQSQVRQRYAGQSAEQIGADLAANGFACENVSRLDCRIEIMERECAMDWYVVVERARPEPIAGFDVMCLGAR